MSKKEPSPSQEAEDDTKTLHTGWIIAAALSIPIILLGVWAITSYQGVNEYTYNGFVFTEVPCEVGMCWQTTVVSNVGEHPILFFHGPQELEDVLVDRSAVERVLNLTRIANSSVIIAFDDGVPGEVGIATSNIARITGDRFYRIPTRGAVYGQDITCSSATTQRAVIYLTQDNTAGVRMDGECILVTAPNTQELVRVADAYTLYLLQIMR